MWPCSQYEADSVRLLGLLVALIELTHPGGHADIAIDERQCPLLALNGQSNHTHVCPLLDNSGQSRILARDVLSAFDLKQSIRGDFSSVA